MRLFRRILTFLLFLCLLAPAFGGQAHAAPRSQYNPVTGWIASTLKQAVPLQPVPVNVAVSGYSGPATLLVFDSAGRWVGNWDFVIPSSGNTTVDVTPRGALGEQWAALYIGENQVTNAVLYTLDAQTTVQTGVIPYDHLYPQVRFFLDNTTLSYWLNGQQVHGYRSPDSPLLWLRDHYYQGFGFQYFEQDVTSLIDAFQRAQMPDGSFPDYLTRPSVAITAERTPVEADVEYLYILAVYEAWKMTGNDEWLRSHLPSMQAAANYTLSHPLRWDNYLGLVKRPFTIDTWDFEYGETTRDPVSGRPSPRHWIDDQTKWGIFHGDNTGMVQALRALAHVEEHVGQWENAAYHRDMAGGILQRLNDLSWNGSFYRHHVKLQPWDVPGVDEERQLSLSNALALNRDVLTQDQAQSILDEYRARLKDPNNLAFAEWWSIDPPFPPGAFGMDGRLGEQPGYYVNGGIMPLVGGELARGAFRYGEEDYGFDILRRYHDLVITTGASYLWYHPTGGPGATGPEVLPTDGWGSSAMLAALLEGAAGVQDNSVRYQDVTISPRWNADPMVQRAYVVARYGASNGYVAYRWEQVFEKKRRPTLKVEMTGSGHNFHLRLLLPPDTVDIKGVTLNGQEAGYNLEAVGESRYLVLNNLPNGVIQVEVACEIEGEG